MHIIYFSGVKLRMSAVDFSLMFAVPTAYLSLIVHHVYREGAGVANVPFIVKLCSKSK